jgi:hypothetical protein
MKELVDTRTVQADDQEENFFDMIFGLGETTEICKD